MNWVQCPEKETVYKNPILTKEKILLDEFPEPLLTWFNEKFPSGECPYWEALKKVEEQENTKLLNHLLFVLYSAHSLEFGTPLVYAESD